MKISSKFVWLASLFIAHLLAAVDLTDDIPECARNNEPCRIDFYDLVENETSNVDSSHSYRQNSSCLCPGQRSCPSRSDDNADTTKTMSFMIKIEGNDTLMEFDFCESVVSGSPRKCQLGEVAAIFRGRGVLPRTLVKANCLCPKDSDLIWLEKKTTGTRIQTAVQTVSYTCGMKRCGQGDICNVGLINADNGQGVVWRHKCLCPQATRCIVDKMKSITSGFRGEGKCAKTPPNV